ncbi:hypothetical protein LWC34_39460 [Kibdelosporangium philippinense]|uniref:Beta/Gamma crystallin n=1 Tax=Kibdelosporangium philippinense TaxID=211113 RepID=A0ABS8ZSP8_9PSEU|nr:hypothetical protein [Kibdelosporangium philippinense]MCE7008847.1 hypothetical protein [Kibdelosporangium philippinense]
MNLTRFLEDEVLLIRRTISAFAVAILSLGGLTAMSGQAFAGTNGQQLTVCTPNKDITSLIFIGKNEKGKDVQTGHLGMQADPDNPNYQNCASATKWWWVGLVQVNFYNNKGYVDVRDVNVPKAQPEGDWIKRSFRI